MYPGTLKYFLLKIVKNIYLYFIVLKNNILYRRVKGKPIGFPMGRCAEYRLGSLLMQDIDF